MLPSLYPSAVNLRHLGGTYDRIVPTVAVFGSSTTEPGSAGWHDAESTGRVLGRAGLAVATGGYGGSMEAVSRGAREAGAEVVGITAAAIFPSRTGANRWVTTVADQPSLSARLGRLVEKTDAAIVLGGSLGTATELMVAWNRLYVASFLTAPKWPLIAVEQPWRVVVERLSELVSAPAGLVTFAPSGPRAAELIVEKLRQGI